MRNEAKIPPALATFWSAPADLPVGDPGRPVCCVATTYTFHAELLESDLLPRFLGIKHDETEKEQVFISEREEELSQIRVSVLVDASQFDRGQSTLRWDQVPVRVPNGVQHAKVTLLARESSLRLIVTSANLTTTGYRRNREIAGVLDFFNHGHSAPRQLLNDALSFLKEVLCWAGSGPAKDRTVEALEDVQKRVRRWESMPEDFASNRLPRISFAGGWPRRDGHRLHSPLETFMEIWGGSRPASDITVMTPSIGEDGESRGVIRKLDELPRKRNASLRLVVPGRRDPEPVTALPKSFLSAWTDEWRVLPRDIVTFIPPRKKEGEKRERDLHAKALLASDDSRALMMFGSSNFSPHGMGVGVSNLEANLCVLESTAGGTDSPGHALCLPVDWEQDEVNAVWPETTGKVDVEHPRREPLPPSYFSWATFNGRDAILKIQLEKGTEPPEWWSIRLPGTGDSSRAPITGSGTAVPSVDAVLTVQMDDGLRGVHLVALRVDWTEGGESCSAYLPVSAESPDALPPPGFRPELTLANLLDSLISGRPIVGPPRPHPPASKPLPRRDDSLRTVDTSGYLLYRARMLGRALTAMGERIEKTLRTRDAMRHRLMNDLLGPVNIAQALAREAKELAASPGSGRTDLAFSLAEIALVVGHVGKRIFASRNPGDPDLRPLFREAATLILQQAERALETAPSGALSGYVGEVKIRCEELLGGLESGVKHAG